LGLSITSSWGNGHATNYRALVKALARRGHEVMFFERDVPWYADNRDLPEPPWGATYLYGSSDELFGNYASEVRSADVVVVGSYVPDGIAVAEWVLDTANGVTAFYDIDTPVTLAALDAGTYEYISPALIPRFDLYLSFTGGATLEVLRDRFGAAHPEAFPCMVDTDEYAPQRLEFRWDLGYLGTYSADRQPALERLLLEPARRRPDFRFVVAGPQYPEDIMWPENVEHVDHLPPSGHAAFYCRQRFTLNVTRADMVSAGWSPSVRLFEAGACATPVISDRWAGLDAFFRPGREILVADDADDVLAVLDHVDEDWRHRVGIAARERVLNAHTATHRAIQLEAAVHKRSVETKAYS
jgi:spore maturation protein CgeB